MMRACRSTRLRWTPLSLVAAAAWTCSPAWAQPTDFFDLGTVTAPVSPPSAQEYVEGTARAFDFINGETFGVKWIRFDLTAPIAGDLYLDIDSRVYGAGADNVLALYDDAGNLIAADDGDGSFPEGIAGGLSFGSTGPRVPVVTPSLGGQDGPALPAGRYWLAFAAGPESSVNFGATNWGITTSATMEASFTNFFELSFSVGNTVPLPPPSNDRCENALPIGENLVPGLPVWIGSNAGALNDAVTPCFNPPTPEFRPREVFFLYTPSRSGKAILQADGGAGGAATPIITAYESCGGVVLRCSGGSSFSFDEPVRIAVDVQAGQPILVSVGIRAAAVGDLSLSVELVPPSCGLATPVGAIVESEACGDDTNGGCNSGGVGFDALALGQVAAGTLFSTRTARDTDWYAFTVPTRTTVALTLRSEYPALAAILDADAPSFCSGVAVAELVQTSVLTSCDLSTREVTLEPGNYVVAALHTYFDGIGCDFGSQRYILGLEDLGCTAPTFTSQPPSNVEVCPGGLAVFSASATSESLQWQVGRLIGPSTYEWFDLLPGEFPAAISTGAIPVNVNSSTLVIFGADAGASIGVAYRLVARGCEVAASSISVLSVRSSNSPECGGSGGCDCSADYNESGSNVPDIEDLIKFFEDFGEGDSLPTAVDGDPSSDINCTGEGSVPDVEDLVRFFEIFTNGC